MNALHNFSDNEIIYLQVSHPACRRPIEIKQLNLLRKMSISLTKPLRILLLRKQKQLIFSFGNAVVEVPTLTSRNAVVAGFPSKWKYQEQIQG